MSTNYAARHVPYDLVSACCVVAGALTVVILFRHSAPERGDIAAVVVAVASLVALAATMMRLRRAPNHSVTIDRKARHVGARWGVVGGLLWVAEIAYNNFVSASSRATDVVARVHRRERVDDIMWTLVAVCILVATLRASRRGGWRAGARAGAWSGLVSGAFACVMALSIVVFAMPALLGDPVNRAEYADLVRVSGAETRGAHVVPRMDDYFAFETLAGAFGHLWILGLMMGALIGSLGGLVGSASARARRPTEAT
jgi:hypothetical protein